MSGTDILSNNACPGYVATDLNGFTGPRAGRGDRHPAGDPCRTTARLFDDNGVVPW